MQSHTADQSSAVQKSASTLEHSFNQRHKYAHDIRSYEQFLAKARADENYFPTVQTVNDSIKRLSQYYEWLKTETNKSEYSEMEDTGRTALLNARERMKEISCELKTFKFYRYVRAFLRDHDAKNLHLAQKNRSLHLSTLTKACKTTVRSLTKETRAVELEVKDATIQHLRDMGVCDRTIESGRHLERTIFIEHCMLQPSGAATESKEKEEDSGDDGEDSTFCEWDCASCTFKNTSEHAFCEVCTSAHPSR